jgi:hypothetical protein
MLRRSQAFGLQLLGEDDEIDFDDGEEEEKAIEIESELGEDAEEQELYGAESVRQRGGLWLSRRAEIKTTGGLQLRNKLSNKVLVSSSWFFVRSPREHAH